MAFRIDYVMHGWQIPGNNRHIGLHDVYEACIKEYFWRQMGLEPRSRNDGAILRREYLIDGCWQPRKALTITDC